MLTRTLRALATTVAAGVALGLVGTAAEAKPTQPGSVTGLVVDSVTPATTSYALAAHWNQVARATKYRVAVTKGGVTLLSTTVAAASWSGTLTTGPGDATLGVRAVIVHKPGKESTVVVPLPDVNAPTGSYVTSKNEATKLGTITETALNDDSGTGGISRTVTWGDGTPPITWAPGSTVLTHPYAAIGRYVPTVTLTDAATNTAHYTLDAIVLGDVTAPTGSVTVAPGAAWTSFTDVVLTPTTLSDDVSTADFIKVHVTWGDGTTADSKGTVPLHHRYAAAGSYDVAAAITDEAGNTTPLSASSVLVSDDKAVPVVKLLLPKVKHSVKAWTTLRGKATDSPGTGVKAVALHAIEKRGTRWYAYKTTTKTWARAKTKAKAFAKSGTLTMHPDRLHRWKGRLVGLRKGTLVYRVTATDNVGNMSARVTHKATLTKR